MQSASLSKHISNQVIENIIEDKVRKRKEVENEYKKSLSKMKERVNNKPLLMESNYNEKTKEIAKMKALAKVESILDNQKIASKDMFSREEKICLEDHKFLESKGLI